MLWFLALLAATIWIVAREAEKAESRRMRLHAQREWQRQEQDRHPWQREEPWTGMEEAHRPTWTRRLRLIAKPDWYREQPRPVFRARRRS